MSEDTEFASLPPGYCRITADHQVATEYGGSLTLDLRVVPGGYLTGEGIRVG